MAYTYVKIKNTGGMEGVNTNPTKSYTGISDVNFNFDNQVFHWGPNEEKVVEQRIGNAAVSAYPSKLKFSQDSFGNEART